MNRLFPPPRCIHIHGVSVGEILSAMPLIERLRADLPETPLLLTCWTPTSMALAHKNFGDDQMITIERLPLDLPWNRGAFLKKHNIAVSLWIDSEIWPGWLRALKKRGVTLAIINGRMSKRSCKNWKPFKPFAKWVLSHYARIDAQSRQDAQHFNELGGRATIQPVNMKYLRPPGAVSEETLQRFQASIAGRPIVLHAMTHPGEEAKIFDLHQTLKQRFPNLLTMNVPRHSHRAAGLAEEAQALGLKTQLRSHSETVDFETDIFFGDTMGETGLYYTLSPISVMGKSFDSNHIGGQSPIEAAYAGCAIVCGPHMTNFPAIMEDLEDANAITVLPDMDALQMQLTDWLTHPETAQQQGERAKSMIARKVQNGPSYLANVVEFIKTRMTCP